MSIIRKIADRIELYDPRTGERFFHYDETNDEVTADKPLNAGSVNTEKQNVGDFRRDEQVYFKEDTDNGTPLSFDTGTISSPHREYQIAVEISGGGTGAFGDVDVRINGKTSGYAYLQLSGSGAASVSSASQWRFQQWNKDGHKWVFDITHPQANATSQNAKIFGPVGSGGGATLIEGSVSNAPEVNQIEITTSFDAEGEFRVFGGETV